MEPSEADHREVQKTIATRLFEEYAGKTGGTLESARDAFVEVVAPWVTYAEAPNVPGAEMERVRDDVTLAVDHLFEAVKKIAKYSR